MYLTKRKVSLFCGLFFIAFVVSFIMAKKISPIGLKLWGDINHNSGIAIDGYDPVAYQTISKATLGSSQYKYHWHGTDWHFSSKENMSLFKSSPKKYAPQYGGYCSFAVSKGVTATTSPEVWYVENDKLYLFMDEEVKADWIKSKGVKNSDENWSH